MVGGEDEVLWTKEAESRVEKAPEFVRPGIYKLMVKRAKERGRQVITSEFLTEIRNEAMLRVAKSIKGFGFEELSMDAFEVAKRKMRKLPRKVKVIEQIKAFLGERTRRNDMIITKFTRYLQMMPKKGLPWTEEALARIQQVPPFVREMAKRAIEEEARRRKEKVITPEVVGQMLAELSRGPSRQGVRAEEATGAEAPRAEGPLQGITMLWTAEAEERIRRIPIPFIRRVIIERVEAAAKVKGLQVVDLETYQAGLAGRG
ncbi:MAG: PCP reductase family protein [Candidatus Methylomirabilales bacterium]